MFIVIPVKAGMFFDNLLLFWPEGQKERAMLSGWNFADALCKEVREKKSILCCGLDPQIKYMPPHLIRRAAGRYDRKFEAIGWLFLEFNRQIIDAVSDLVACVKPQMAFYEAYGADGVWAFEKTVEYAKSKGLLVIGDLKRGDGGDTADAYASGHLGEVPVLGNSDNPLEFSKGFSPACVDAMTIHGYIGEDCVLRFVKVAKENGTGVFVVTKTSFKPNSFVEQLITESGCPVWQEVAKMVRAWGVDTEGLSGLSNLGVVMGATYPQDAVIMRQILPNAWFLIPGFGSQGGAAEAAVVGIRKDGLGGVVNTSRALTFAWCDKKGKYACESVDFAQAARSKATDDRNALVEACRQAGKWPF